MAYMEICFMQSAFACLCRLCQNILGNALGWKDTHLPCCLCLSLNLILYLTRNIDTLKKKWEVPHRWNYHNVTQHYWIINTVIFSWGLCGTVKMFHTIMILITPAMDPGSPVFFWKWCFSPPHTTFCSFSAQIEWSANLKQLFFCFFLNRNFIHTNQSYMGCGVSSSLSTVTVVYYFVSSWDFYQSVFAVHRWLPRVKCLPQGHREDSLLIGPFGGLNQQPFSY